MKSNEVYQLLCKGKLTIAFDTNAVFRHRQFLRICDKINQLHDELHYELTLVISALVHTEKLFDLKQGLKDKYDLDVITQSLQSKRIHIQPYERHHAEATANLIGQQFPTNKEWYTFKRQTCVDCLGLQHAKVEIQGKGKQCGATVDWLIAGHADAEDCLLITQDKGEEFKGIEKKTDLECLETALDQLLQSTKTK